MATLVKPVMPSQGHDGSNGFETADSSEELKAKYKQVCEERDALEDLLLQEQLKNDTPLDSQLEAAQERMEHVEQELQASVARAEEWRRRAQERGRELQRSAAQMLELQGRLADLDDEDVPALQGEVQRLRIELAKSEALRFDLFRQLREGLPEGEEERLRRRVRHLENQLHDVTEATAGMISWTSRSHSSGGSLSELTLSPQQHAKAVDIVETAAETTPAGIGPHSAKVPPTSPLTPLMGPMQELLAMGEASLESAAGMRNDIKRLSMSLQEAAERAEAAEKALLEKTESMKEMQIKLSTLEVEVLEERTKAAEEAEDLTQEMAELRYQLMEMLEGERELRAQTEQSSVRRVQELENQVSAARQEAVTALAQKAEALNAAEELEAVLRDREGHLALLESQLEAQEAQADDAQALQSAGACAEEDLRGQVSSLERECAALKETVREVCVERDRFESDAEQLRRSLHDAVGTSARLAGALDKLEEQLAAQELSFAEERTSAQEEHKSEMQIMQQNLEEESTRLSEMKQRKHDAEGELRGALSRLDAVEAELAACTRQLQDANERATRGEEEAEMWMQRAKEQNRQIAKLKEEEESLTQQLSASSQDALDLRQRIEALDAEAAGFKSELSRQQDRLKDQQEGMQERERKLQAAEEHRLAQNAALATASEDISKLTKECSFLREEAVRQATAATVASREAAARHGAAVKVLEDSVIKLRTELSMQRSEIELSRKRVRGLEAESATKAADVARLIEELQRTRSRAKEEVAAEWRRHAEEMATQRQAELFLSRQLERLESVEAEKEALEAEQAQLQADLAQMTAERDEARTENIKRRAGWGKR